MEIEVIEEKVAPVLLLDLNDVAVLHVAAGEVSLRWAIPGLIEVENSFFSNVPCFTNIV